MAKTIRTIWPNVFDESTSAAYILNIQNVGDSYNIIFQQSENINVSEIGLHQFGITGSPGTLTVGLQGVGATGYPDGSFIAGGTAFSSNTNWSSSNDDKFLSFVMPSGVSLTGGNFYSFVVSATGGTWDVSNRFSFYYSQDLSNNVNTFPYGITNNVRDSSSNTMPKFVIRSSQKSYGGLCFESLLNTVNITSTTTPDEVGVKFNAPKSWGRYYYISGARLFYLIPSIASGNYSADMIIYDSDGSTILQSTKIWLEQRGENASPKTGQRIGPDPGNIFFSGNLARLETGKNYYFSFKPNDNLNGSTSYTLYYEKYTKSQDYTWLNKNQFIYCERTNDGSWTEYDTRVLKIQLFIDQIIKTPKVYNIS